MSELTKLVDSFVANKPEASPFVDTLLNENTQESSSNGVGTSIGNHADSTLPESDQLQSEQPAALFDPSIHRVDAAGNPIPKKDGSGWQRKRGRRSGVGIDAINVDPVARLRIDAKNAAIVTVQVIVMCGMAIGGEEWTPQDIELTAMQTAWTDYYVANGITNLPPWLGVAIATGGYALPRFRLPKTRGRITAFFTAVVPATKKVFKWVLHWS